MSTHTAAKAAFGLALVLGGLTRPAFADDKDTLAEGLFRQAQKLLGDGKVHDACEKFAASQRVQPAIGTLLNLAACHEKEGKTATAWSEYADVYAEAMKQGDTARGAFAQKRRTTIEPTLSQLTFDVDQPADGEALSLDGVALPREAWTTPLPVDPGAHTLHATAPRRQAVDVKFEVSAQAAQAGPPHHVVVPRLLPESAAPVPSIGASSASSQPSDPASPPPDQAPSQGGTRTLGLIVGGTGVVAVAVGAAFLGSALVQAGNRNSECAPGAPCPSSAAYQRAASDHDTAKTDQTLGLVIGGVGLLATAAGAYLWFTGGPSASAPRVGFAPWVDGHRAGIGATGRF